MDVNNQLLVVALKQGVQPNWQLIGQQIDDAGYLLWNGSRWKRMS